MTATRQSRLMIAKLVLKLMQHYSAIIFLDQHFGKHAQDIVIMLGVSVGTHEGKPMTAAKLADFVCIPRATIVRRVKLLSDMGLLDLNHQKQISLSESLDQRAMKTAPVMNKSAILRTAAFLSKLDSEAIASKKGR